MVLMQDRAAGIPNIAPISPFVSPREILADALPLLQPATRITVTDAAEMYLHVPLAGVWKKFDRDIAPYMVEPADITQSRRFQAVAFVGPSQSAKTTMLMTVAMHAVMCEPDPVRIVHMDRRSADSWVEEKLDPAIQNSPFIRERMGRAREDSTFSRKRFKGMRITIGYPVATFLSSTSQKKVLLTDYDHMPQVLGPKDSPEGSPYGMARQRIRTYMSRGCVLLESSPAFPVTDPHWRRGPGAPHEMPPVSGGIVRIYNEGTRGRWYWECPDCTEMYEPTFDKLEYDASLDPGEAGAAAEMVCPHCGCPIRHRHKVELNRMALRGRGGWMHEGSAVDDEGKRALVRIGDAGVRGTDVASYALNGAAAAFASWEGIVTSFENARRQLETFGDDTELARVFYTERGEPYAPRKDSAEGELTVAVLRDHVRDLPKGTAPGWTRFITTSIDAQGSSFAVMVTAWGMQGERIIIDRFALAQPPADAPRAADRGLDPGKYAEDAEVLTELATRVYPVQGMGHGLMPLMLAVDFNGPAGWSDNAEAFWRKRSKAGQGHMWFLSFGRPGFHQRDRVWHEAPERGSRGKKGRSIKLLNMSVDRLKDSVLAALGRFDGAVGAYHLPNWLIEDHLAELLAEERGPKGYDKKPGAMRNETLDLSVQALAMAEHKGLNRINWEAPPDWARNDETNTRAVVLAGATGREAAPEGADAAPRPAAPLRKDVAPPATGTTWITPRDSWI